MIDPELLAAVEAVWRIKPPLPDNLSGHPTVEALAAICTARFGGETRMTFSLIQALRSLGMPCALEGHADLALDAATAAAALETGLSQTTALRRYLVPLDLADDFPPSAFGTV